MKVRVECGDGVCEDEITIRCREMTDDIIKIVALANSAQKKLLGSIDRQVVVLEAKEVYYIESVDDNVFIYTGKKVYGCALRLYEIEKDFSHTGFFRANKSTIINLERVRALDPLLNGKIQVVFDNGEKQLVSRQYAPVLRRKIGMMR